MARVFRHGGFAAFLALCAGLAIWFWGFGGVEQVAGWAAQEQRAVQSALAGALRGLRGGEPGALAVLLGLCFAYGFFHAAGPGHGKLVMGGYALGTAVPRARIIGLTLAGALGQAVTAVLLVALGALVLGWGRTQMTDMADGALQVASAAAIALVGVWLLWRGLLHWRAAGQAHAHGHDHAGCGHSHGPDPSQIVQARDWRAALGIVLAVAIRPCTGAVFVLILTFSMGIAWAGVLGALVMSLGTSVLTLMVALGAGSLRGGLAERLEGPGGLRAMAAVEMAAGCVVAVVAGQVVLLLL